MYEIFEHLMQVNGYTAYKVSIETGIAQSTLSDWKKGKSTPKADKLQKIADLFNVSLNYLMTGEEKEDGETYYLNDETREIAQAVFENPDLRSLFDMSRKMPPDRLKAHIEFMKKMQEAENNTDL